MDIKEYITKKTEEINKALETIIPNGNKAEEAARYVLLAPGHRWRPLLTLALSDSFKNPYPNSEMLACASECMHAASMILDDLPCMDNAKLRRGKPTCHIKYGENIAILAAIRLVNASWHIISKFCPEKYRTLLLHEGNRVSERMISGQVADLTFSPKNETDVLKMYAAKNGDLFAFSILAGTYFIGWPLKKIYEFGSNLGIAHQIADDLQDVLLDVDQVGKDVKQDMNKKTLINFLGIDGTRKIAETYKAKAKTLIKGRIPAEYLLNEIVVIN